MSTQGRSLALLACCLLAAAWGCADSHGMGRDLHRPFVEPMAAWAACAQG